MSTLLLVHAHPDDESILTGGVIARARLDGHRAVLVTATRGEEGHIHDTDERSAAPPLGEVRSAELANACAVLGVDRQEFLGFRDSDGDGSAAERHPEAFRVVSLDTAASRLAAIVREERPEVVVTYASDGTYGHPDHIKAHATTLAALDLLRAEGWRPFKVYGHAVPRSFVVTVVQAARLGDITLPKALAYTEGIADEEITTTVDVSSVLDRKLAACVAHESQMQSGLPLAIMAANLFEAAFGVERFVLIRGELGGAGPELSLFAGL